MEEHAVDPQGAALHHAAERARLPLAVGLAAAGATVALGYLLGLVQGPLVAVAGGIALMTVGRGLGRASRETAMLCAAFLVLAGGWNVVAMRWSSLMVDDLRGAQGVLGPTLLVGPAEIVVGLATAAGGCLVALAVWAASPPIGGRAVWVRGIESVPAALATVTVFWGPAIAGAPPETLAAWGGGVALLALIATAGARFVRNDRARTAALAVAASAVLVGAGSVGRGL